METRKKTWMLVVGLIVLAIAIAVGCLLVFAKSPEKQLEEKARFYAENLIKEDYETALSITTWLPEHNEELAMFAEMLESDDYEPHVIDYRIDHVNKLTDDLYQVDGWLFSKYEDAHQDYCPFYYRVENKWFFALNEYEVPKNLREGVEYKREENAIDPDEIEFYFGVE